MAQKTKISSATHTLLVSKTCQILIIYLQVVSKKGDTKLNTGSNSLETVKFGLFTGFRIIHLGEQFLKMFNTGLLFA